MVGRFMKRPYERYGDWRSVQDNFIFVPLDFFSTLVYSVLSTQRQRVLNPKKEYTYGTD